MEDNQLEIQETPVLTREEKNRNIRRVIFDILETLILALVLYFGIDAVSARVRVQNISMLPTLHEGQFILVSKMAYKFDKPQIGDIVVFHAPPEPGEDFIKRVIGTGGDTVAIENGFVSVNGIELDEGYIAAAPDYSGTWDVPQDKIFVLGDNRNLSSDSHKWGYVPMDQVVGKAVVIYWPINEFNILQHPRVALANQMN